MFAPDSPNVISFFEQTAACIPSHKFQDGPVLFLNPYHSYRVRKCLSGSAVCASLFEPSFDLKFDSDCCSSTSSVVIWLMRYAHHDLTRVDLPTPPSPLKFIVSTGAAPAPPQPSAARWRSLMWRLRAMWLLVAIALVVGVLFAVSVRAWMSVLKQETDRRECPACKGRLALTPDKDEGFALEVHRLRRDAAVRGGSGAALDEGVARSGWGEAGASDLLWSWPGLSPATGLRRVAVTLHVLTVAQQGRRGCPAQWPGMTADGVVALRTNIFGWASQATGFATSRPNPAPSSTPHPLCSAPAKSPARFLRVAVNEDRIRGEG